VAPVRQLQGGDFGTTLTDNVLSGAKVERSAARASSATIELTLPEVSDDGTESKT
jgi:hypothetical protein